MPRVLTFVLRLLLTSVAGLACLLLPGTEAVASLPGYVLTVLFMSAATGALLALPAVLSLEY